MINTALSAILGLAVADALGVPVEFNDREYLSEHLVTDMQGYGTYNVPAGSWSDDTSMTLCLADSIAHTGDIDLDDIMERFTQWLIYDEYTPTGETFDCGGTSRYAVNRYNMGTPAYDCGGKDEGDNGNGALMRILPMAFYFDTKGTKDLFACQEDVKLLNTVSGLTHGHPRSQIACCIYVQIALNLINDMPLREAMVQAVSKAMGYYDSMLMPKFRGECTMYDRLRDIQSFINLPESEIHSGGYVVHTLEAALWCLLNTDTYKDAALKAVNLGEDTDTTAAVAGGLAGLMYGINGIPVEWLDALQRREFVEDIAGRLVSALYR